MKKKYDSLGVMLDFSRNGVMTVEALKRFLSTIRKMGYNTAFLYMEDTYQVEGEPYFGYMRSRYSIEEMKEIDEFCASIGIEAIPCIQVLAHMQTFFKWDKVGVDTGDILLADDERTYELISNMFKTLSSVFRSRKIHIGMDEAHLLGKGRYYHEHGHVKSSEIIRRHLDRVIELAKPYGYSLLLWSDMFFRIWNKDGYYLDDYTKVPEWAIEALPDKVIPVYWDYYQPEEKNYDIMLKAHAQFKSETWFAGGAWTWSGYAPLNEVSMKFMKQAMNACYKNKTKNIFMTMWGDDGMECSHFSILPALHYIAECARGNTDDAKIKAKFKRIMGVDFDDFIKLDLPNKISPESKKFENPSKYMLFSDPFVGFLDYTVDEKHGALYAEHRDALYSVAKKTRKYGYLFKTLAALCDVLDVKYTLGTKTRKAYKEGNKEELRRLANEEYLPLIKKVKTLHKYHEAQWYADYKPSGYEVHDGRHGALMQRLESCAKRLIAYADGKIDKIDELEVDILPFLDKVEGQPIHYTCYGRIATPNVLTHAL